MTFLHSVSRASFGLSKVLYDILVLLVLKVSREKNIFYKNVMLICIWLNGFISRQ